MNFAKETANNPIGFHYFQDTLHYSTQDLSTWLPDIKKAFSSLGRIYSLKLNGHPPNNSSPFD
jgi:hypothetical protein